MEAAAPALNAGTFRFDGSGNLQTRSYADIAKDWNNEQVTFANISIPNKKKDLVTYNSQQVDPNLTKIKKYLKH